MDLDLVTTVHLAGLALTAEAVRRLHDAGYEDLRTAHGFVIQHVVDGPRPVGEVATRLGVTQQAASKSLGELVELGYLERIAHPADARIRLVGLSERGRAAVVTSRRIRAEVGAELAASLGSARTAAFREAAAAALEWAGGGEAARARRVREQS